MLTWPTIGAELGGGISILVSGEADLSSSVFGVSLAWGVVPAVIKGGMVGSGTDAVGGGCRGACPVGESEGTSGVTLVVDGGAAGVTILGTDAVGGGCRGACPVGESEGTSGIALVVDGGAVGVTVLGTGAVGGGCRGTGPVGKSEGTSGVALVVDGGVVGVTVLGTGAVGGECRGTGPVGKSEGTSGVALVIDGGVVGVTVLGTDTARGTRVASLRASSEPSKSITCAAGGGPSFVLAFFRVTSSFLGSRSLALRLEGRRP